MSTAPNKKLATYKTVHMQTASPAKKVVMLYDGIINQLRHAVEAFDESSPDRNETIHNAIQKASQIILELKLALDEERGGEVALSLDSLYVFWLNHLSEANAAKKPSPVEEVLSMVLEIRDAWDQAARMAQT